MAGRRGAAFFPPATNMFLLAFTLYLALCSATPGYYIDEQMIDTTHASSPPDLDTLLVDLRAPPVPPNPKAWTLATEADALQRRSLEKDDDNSEDESAHSVSSSHTSVASSETSTSSASLPTQSSEPRSLPMPFDKGFGGNITNSCSSFVLGFIAEPTFKSCLPFSLLLKSSEAFFQACKSVLEITRTLDATCAANVDTCTEYMNILSTNLTTACASELSVRNPMVVQAQFGLQAYAPIYTASCLRNPTTSSYCFADAITNRTSPTDSYIYYLPLNVSFPDSGKPTCNTCLVNTMAVFEKATSNRSSPIASYYTDAAQQINVHCGPAFVNTSLAAASTPSIAGRLSAPGAGLAFVILLGAFILGGF